MDGKGKSKGRGKGKAKAPGRYLQPTERGSFKHAPPASRAALGSLILSEYPFTVSIREMKDEHLAEAGAGNQSLTHNSSQAKRTPTPERGAPRDQDRARPYAELSSQVTDPWALAQQQRRANPSSPSCRRCLKAMLSHLMWRQQNGYGHSRLLRPSRLAYWLQEPTLWCSRLHHISPYFTKLLEQQPQQEQVEQQKQQQQHTQPRQHHTQQHHTAHSSTITTQQQQQQQQPLKQSNLPRKVRSESNSLDSLREAGRATAQIPLLASEESAAGATVRHKTT